jgi:hypothetical protein
VLLFCPQKAFYRETLNNLSKYIKNEKRGYVDMKGKEYWQYWKDERDKKSKLSNHFHKHKRGRW